MCECVCVCVLIMSPEKSKLYFKLISIYLSITTHINIHAESWCNGYNGMEWTHYPTHSSTPIYIERGTNNRGKGMYPKLPSEAMRKKCCRLSSLILVWQPV